MKISTFAAISTGMLVSTVFMLPSKSLAGSECNINAKSITGTYGFATSGDAYANNALNLPVGRFSQAGTITQSNVTDNGSTLTGNWNVLVQQNSQAGEPVTLPFKGNFVVSKETCTGQLFLENSSSPAFFTVFVNRGNEQRTTSLVPGIVVSYPSSKKLEPITK